ncbi:MAG: MerR family transcriptional regulator [Kiritimatiellae bacterium]|nr:MerR family transcriptional regulator [Kiritimatiellia bacterium]
MSELTGYTPDTLRFYEKSGLLPGIKRRGRRRAYTDADCYAIGIVTCLKDTGMPLGEIRRYMELAAKGERSVDERLAIMKRQAESIKSQMAVLKLCEERILFKVWYYETAKREGLSAVADIEAAVARYRMETKRKVTFDMPCTGHEALNRKGTKT